MILEKIYFFRHILVLYFRCFFIPTTCLFHELSTAQYIHLSNNVSHSHSKKGSFSILKYHDKGISHLLDTNSSWGSGAKMRVLHCPGRVPCGANHPLRNLLSFRLCIFTILKTCFSCRDTTFKYFPCHFLELFEFRWKLSRQPFPSYLFVEGKKETGEKGSSISP